MSADGRPLPNNELAAKIRISPLRYFDVRRSGAGVSVRCRKCNELIREPRQSAPLDLIVLSALNHVCPSENIPAALDAIEALG